MFNMNILILGGTKFVGKKFVEYISNYKNINLILANRGFSGRSDVYIDRENTSSCSNLKNIHPDIVVDFSCYNLNQFKNTFYNLNFIRYIFISSSAVEAIPFHNVEPDMQEMAQYAYNKKECEEFIQKNIENYSIIRPCYIVGDEDYTNRFYKKNEKYYWINGQELTYYIETERLCEFIFKAIQFNRNIIVNPCNLLKQ